MTIVCRMTLLLTTLLVSGCGSEPAKPPPTAQPVVKSRTNQVRTESDLTLTHDGRAYHHERSQTAFRLTSGWKSSLPMTASGVTSLDLRQGDDTAVTITWSPLRAELVEIVSAKLKSFRKRYGDKNVGLLESATSGNQTGWKVELKSDAQGDLSRRVCVYWFGVNSTDGTRWKIKLRATYPEDADTLPIDRLLGQFEWPESEHGTHPD